MISSLNMRSVNELEGVLGYVSCEVGFAQGDIAAIFTPGFGH
jgi:hypothetical protein